MKILSLGWYAALLLPVGTGLALLGFWLDNQAARTSLQLLGLGVLCAGLWLGQRLLKPLANDAE